MSQQLICLFNKKKKKIYLRYNTNFGSFCYPQMSFIFVKKQLFFFNMTKFSEFCYYKVKKSIFAPYKVIVKLNGLNFKINIFKNYLHLNIGYSHPFYIKFPKGLVFTVLEDKKNIFMVESFNSALVYGFIAILRQLKPINNYTQTGFSLYKELIKIKIGKKK